MGLQAYRFWDRGKPKGKQEKKMEEKKPEEKKAEEGKEEKKEEAKPEKPSEEKKAEDSKDSKEPPAPPPPPPPPPQEIVLSVFLHCEGCARKVRSYLKGFQGVEDVQTDWKTDKVVVKGEKADPLKVKERVEMKSHRQVELLSPIPKPPAPEDGKNLQEKEAPKPEEKKEEPQVITVVMKAHMHCEACAQEIKKRIQKMKGVENAEPDLKSSHVTVKGAFDPKNLVEYVYKRTGKHAVIVKQEPEKKEEEKPKEEKKGEDGGKDTKKGEVEDSKEKKEGGQEAPPPQPAAAAATAEEETKVVELKKNELLYFLSQNDQQPYYYHPQNYQYQNHQQYHPQFPSETYAAHPAYPPQMFSDENPNACSVM
uniref:Putative caldesmon isoform X2 n=2 Tax=Davidia involucrata TaxID=16924 RepID=A0A5B6Z0F0_DAVIN